MASLDDKQHLKGQGGVDESGKGQTPSKQNKNEQNNQMIKKDTASLKADEDGTHQQGVGKGPQQASNVVSPDTYISQDTDVVTMPKDTADAELSKAVSPKADEDGTHQQGVGKGPQQASNVVSSSKAGEDGTHQPGADERPQQASDVVSSRTEAGDTTSHEGGGQDTEPASGINTSRPGLDKDSIQPNEVGREPVSGSEDDSSSHAVEGEGTKEQGADQGPTTGIRVDSSNQDTNHENTIITEDQAKRMVHEIMEKNADIKSYLTIIDQNEVKLSDVERKLKEAHDREVQMQTEIENLKTDVANKASQMTLLQEKAEDEHEFNEQTAKNYQDTANKNSRLESEIEQIEKRKNIMEHNAKILETRNENQRKHIRELYDKLKNAESRNGNQGKHIQELNDKLKTITKEKETAEKLTKEMEKRCTIDKAEIENRMSKSIEHLDKERNKLQKLVNDLTKENDQVKSVLDQYVKGYNRASTDVDRLKSENKDLHSYKNKYHTLTQEIETLRNTTRSLEVEKETLLLRLSKIAGANLTYNNPNIADLSDEKRPTKLAEEFSELYDNEWTDAFDEVDGDDDEIKTRVLYDLLKHANTYCAKLSVGHDEAIQASFTTLNYIRTQSQNAETEHEDSTKQKHSHKIHKPSVEEKAKQQANQTTGDRVVQNQKSKTGMDNNHTSNTQLEDEVTDNSEEEDLTEKEDIEMLNKSETEEACDDNNEDVAVEDGDKQVSTETSDSESNTNNESGTKKTNISMDATKGESKIKTQSNCEKENTASEAENNGKVESESSGKNTGSEVTRNVNSEAQYKDTVKKVPDARHNMNVESEVQMMGNVDNVNDNRRAKDNVNVMSETEINENGASNADSDLITKSESDNNIYVKTGAGTTVDVESETGKNVDAESKDGNNGNAETDASKNVHVESKAEEIVKAESVAQMNLGAASEAGIKKSEARKRVNEKIADKETEMTEQETGNVSSTETSGDANNLNDEPESKEDDKSTVQSEDEQYDCQNCKNKLISKVDFKFDDLSKEQKKMLGDIKKLCETQQSEDVKLVGAKIIAKEMNVNTESKEIMTYIAKCIDICWSMHRHVPPVYIYFPSNVTDESFDTKVYRAYTKSGKRIHFVVWPAIHLHEGGPLLGKGVAQGRN